jgi:hypothetical protein
MRRRVEIMTLALFALLTLCGLVAYFWFDDRYVPVRSSCAPPVTKPLSNNSELVGTWLRVDPPKPEMVGHWRAFTADGEFRACYGCVVSWGTYRFVDNSTLETRDGHDGTLHQWTVGHAGDRIVLVHRKYGWVEQYFSAPPSFEP